MARGRPFFSGNYGGPLGSFDTAAQLIAESGRVQGQMFANLGKTIGSTLDDFRAKKEKREREKAAENQFLRMYDEAPTNPIFGSFGIQNREEAEAAAKDIAKDPSLVTQAMEFAQTQMSLEANELAKKKQRRDRRKERTQTQTMQNFLNPDASGISPAEVAYPQAAPFIKRMREGSAGQSAMDPKTMLPLIAAAQGAAQPSKVGSYQNIVNPKTGETERVAFDDQGNRIKSIGTPPKSSFFGTPEEQADADLLKERQKRALDYIDGAKKTALDFGRSMTSATRIERLLDKGVQTGGINQIKANLATFAQSLGVDLPDDIKEETADAQALMSASGDFLFQAISQTKGAISNKEMGIFESISPGMRQSVEGNRAMIKFIKAIGNREKRKMEMIRKLEKKNKSPIEIRAKIEDFLIENDLSGLLEPISQQIDQTNQPGQPPAASNPSVKPTINLPGGGIFQPQ